MRISSYVVLSIALAVGGTLTALSHAREGAEQCSDRSAAPANTPIVAPWVAKALLLSDPKDDHRALRLPPALAGRDFATAVSLRVCVSESGAVSNVEVLGATGATIEASIASAVMRWRYRPYSVNGRPSAFCYGLRYKVSTT